MTVYDSMPPVPVWDDEGSTIDLPPIDSIVDYVLTDHGVEIDWSTGDTAEQVTNQIGPGECIEYDELHYIFRAVAHIAMHPPTQPTPEEIAQQVLDNHRIRDDWRRTGEQIRALIAEAIRIERGES